MLKILLFYFLVLIYSPYLLISQTDRETNKIYVKFKLNSEIYSEWKINRRFYEIATFKSILGENTAKPFITDATIKAFSGKKNAHFQRMVHSTEESLARIAIVEYSGDIAPEVASRKISSREDIEYAEPIPISKFSFIPDDPRIKYQFYLSNIKVFEAWDILGNADTIVVGIVDTGIDYTHVDLKDNIFTNSGEIGLDKDGNDKKDNDYDDDDNGFIDDWRGWDFVSSESLSGDNDPKPGHKHGTHVAGTVGAIVNNGIGIAGVCRQVKLMPVKVAYDNPQSISVSNGFEGILYAAAMGADVINCSWGSSSRSNAEQEIIDEVVSLGSIVVAAAGNDGRFTQQYPASYHGVMSVAAVDSSDRRSYFSNWHYSVDVSAPGYEIYSTVPDDWYEYLNGTSMASPIAAGVVALVKQKYPEYSPLQCIEHVKVSSDNTDEMNKTFTGMLGKGRVNALSAMTIENPKSIIMTDYTILDENSDYALDAGETVSIGFTLLNVLSPVNNVQVLASEESFAGVEFIIDAIDLGDIGTMKEIISQEKITFRIPENVPPDFDFKMSLTITDSQGYKTKEYIEMILYPSYRTLDGNNITVTFNNRGNIAFNDYPTNLQGNGFAYKGSSNLLFEGALMVAVAPDKVSNVARGSAQMAQNRSFISNEIFAISKPGTIANQEGIVHFSDISLNVRDIGVDINEHIYQFNDSGKEDFIICVYDIENISNNNYDSMFVGLYFDWDIGPSGRDNQAYFDNSLRFGYTKNTVDPDLPITAVQLLSFQKLSYFAIDNDGTTEDNPGVWDGFTYEEKWEMLSGGIQRTESSITDASQVIGCGPIHLNSGGKVRVAFAIFAADNISNLKNISVEAYQTAITYGLANGEINEIPRKDKILELYPNPIDMGDLHFTMLITEETHIKIDIYDLSGKKACNTINENVFVSGHYDFNINTDDFTQGTYLLKISTKNETFSKFFVIIR